MLFGTSIRSVFAALTITAKPKRKLGASGGSGCRPKGGWRGECSRLGFRGVFRAERSSSRGTIATIDGDFGLG